MAIFPYGAEKERCLANTPTQNLAHTANGSHPTSASKPAPTHILNLYPIAAHSPDHTTAPTATPTTASTQTLTAAPTTTPISNPD